MHFCKNCINIETKINFKTIQKLKLEDLEKLYEYKNFYYGSWGIKWVIE